MRHMICEHEKVMRAQGVSHLTMTINSRFWLKQDVDPDVLLTALQDTLKLYPIFGMTYEQDGDDVWLCDNDEPPAIYEEDRILVPDGKRMGGRLYFVGYKRRMISLSADHIFSDGMGVQKFFNTMLERYGKLLDGTAEPITGPAYDLETMYRQVPSIPPADYRKYEPFRATGEAIHLPIVTNASPYRVYTCKVSESAFMDYVRKHESSAMAAIFQVASRGIFSRHPEGDYIRMIMIVSTKKALGMEESFANMWGYAAVDITREEADDPGCLKRIRADIKGLNSEDNIRYETIHPNPMETYQLSLNTAFLSSYLRLGDQTNGVAEKHQSIPISINGLPKLDVRASDGWMEFVVAGSPECLPFYECVKYGLTLSGFEIASEEVQEIELSDEMIIVKDNH